MLYSGNWFGNLSKVKQLKVRVKIYVCVNFRDSFPTFDFSWCLSSRDSCCQFKTLKWAKKFLRTFQSWLRSAATRISHSDQLLISASARILNSPSAQFLAQPSKPKCYLKPSHAALPSIRITTKMIKRPPSCVLVTLLTPQCGVPSPPRERWTQKDWYDPTNVLNVPNFLKKVEHNGADTSKIKCLLYSRCPHTQPLMHDLDVTVRVIEYLIYWKPHSSADLVPSRFTPKNLSKTYKSQMFPINLDIF